MKGTDDIDPTFEYLIFFPSSPMQVLDNDSDAVLDRTWRRWSGLGRLVSSLAHAGYAVRRLHVWRAVNAKPDVLKYSMLLEITSAEEEDDLKARDVLQRFRIGRMSGYVALYQALEGNDLEKAVRSTESLGALIYSLADED